KGGPGSDTHDRGREKRGEETIQRHRTGRGQKRDTPGAIPVQKSKGRNVRHPLYNPSTKIK
ncbi:MAG TPA: hypothetical protein VKY45_00110, partial [Marinilabiliaceae bacterium]|nr:hypothetical protein [Marinilabiliaceae bacterium]